MERRDLSELRQGIAGIDSAIVELAARRTRLAVQIGEIKRRAGTPIRDFVMEKEVVERARVRADELGLSPEVAERLMLELIRSSLVVQEQGQVQASSAGSGKRALVVGGAGRMGGWFVRFLRSQGFSVEIADPAGEDGAHADWRHAGNDFDVYVVAAPLSETREVLKQMAESPPKGLIFDVGSLKTPLREALTRLSEVGAMVTSVHPMFGPGTDLLSGRHVVFVDVGVPDATEQARELFASTMATLVDMDLDSHDRLIAYILGLSHALNISFFTALAESGEAAGRLAELSSTTFDNQLAVASQVATENPRLYYEIQALNRYGMDALTSLHEATGRLRYLVAQDDEEGFVALMERGARYLRSTQPTGTR